MEKLPLAGRGWQKPGKIGPGCRSISQPRRGILPDVSELQFITGNCPMMYLSIGPNIHALHRSIAKLIWKY